MARTWLSIEVQLVAGRGEELWPRPGRVFVARRTFSFRQLAHAINTGFGRWELSHLHRFVLEDGTEILPLDWWDDAPEDAVDDSTKLSILEPGQQFAYEFDLGDGWEHLCTVAPERVDPLEVYGTEPESPAVIFGWGDLPDQHGARWADDDGQREPPAQPDPPLSDLPPIMPHWGDWTPPTPGESAGWLSPMRDWDQDSWNQLRGAVARGDGQTVVDLLIRHDPLDAAHLAGDGLLVALEQRLESAYALARLLAAELRDRYLPGDEALADQLDAARGTMAPPELAPIPVELDEVAMHLEGDQLEGGAWRLDVETGRLWPDDPEGLVGEDRPGHWEDPDRWVELTSLGSRAAWQDMAEFTERVEDAELADRLDRAIRGKGAFRSFKDVLAAHDPAQLRAWFRFAEERQRGRAREYLALRGYRAVPPTRRG